MEQGGREGWRWSSETGQVGLFTAKNLHASARSAWASLQAVPWRRRLESVVTLFPVLCLSCVDSGRDALFNAINSLRDKGVSGLKETGVLKSIDGYHCAQGPVCDVCRPQPADSMRHNT